MLLTSTQPQLPGKIVPGNWGWVLVSNIVGYGGVLRLSPDRVLDDGLFEVYLFPHGTRWALVKYGLLGLLRRLPGRSCKMVLARRVRVESDHPVPYEVDGDFGGETPVDFEVAPERLNEDPYGAGWICEIELSDPLELDDLIDAASYSALIAG